jgi:hypothetical protein
MKSATAPTVLAIGAVFAFAVKGHPSKRTGRAATRITKITWMSNY